MESGEYKCACVVTWVKKQRCQRRTLDVSPLILFYFGGGIRSSSFAPVCVCVCFSCEGVCVSGPQKQMPARSSVGSSWRALRPASLRSSVFGSQEHPRVSPGFLTPTPRDYSNSCACDKKVEVSKLEDHSQSILLESLAESFLNATRLGAVVFIDPIWNT